MKISIVGSGNVATGLGRAFFAAGHAICDVFSRSAAHAAETAGKVNARPVTRLNDLRADVDLFLIAVKDDAIAEVAQGLSAVITTGHGQALDAPAPGASGNLTPAVVAHTAGSIPLEVLSLSSPNHGVFYPFQTFSREREADISGMPCCLEASNAATADLLEALAQSIGGRVYEAGSAQRKALHVAGAFACNFTNHCYAIAEELLREEGLPFDIIRPLIRETAEKALTIGPPEAQTGPAVRNDQTVLAAHRELLSEKPALRELYTLLSASILKFHQSEGSSAGQEGGVSAGQGSGTSAGQGSGISAEKGGLILASKSPRRQELLRDMGLHFEVLLRETDESYPAGLAPREVALHIAEKKARAFESDLRPGNTLIAADTIVVLGNEILGKPRDRDGAMEMLGKLSGREHQVITGVALLREGRLTSFAEITRVRFAPLSTAEILFYVDNYHPFDKAGAYGIQEWIGYNKITRIDGSYTNVVGLPTEALYRHLR